MKTYRARICPHTSCGAKTKGIITGSTSEAVGEYHAYNPKRRYFVLEVEAPNREAAHRMLEQACMPHDPRPLAGISYLKPSTEKHYEGDHVSRKVFVVDGSKRRELPLRLDLAYHSPCGFCWGYNGSGPSQLALAICADLLGDEKGRNVHQEVKREVIAGLPMDKPFKLTESFIRNAIEKKDKHVQ